VNNDNINIKEIRKNADLTQEEFADRLGITREMVGQMERGTKRISKATKILINNFLQENKSPSNLMEDQHAAYNKTPPKVENPADFLTHEVIEMKAIMRVILRSQAEVLAEKRSESVTKVLGELSKAVKDEISVSFSELKQGK